METSPHHNPEFSLWRRILLCVVMIALESFISYEEIFMLALLQSADVPTSLVSLPGTLSSAIGVFIIPLLGWASDKKHCCMFFGQKRPFALLTMTVITIGMCILLVVNGAMLYSHTNDTSLNISSNIDFAYDEPDSSANSSVLYVPLLGILGIIGFTLSDHGYDSSMSTVKAYMLSVTPPSQHDSVLVYATLLGAFGGCLTSLLGFLDLASLFPADASQGVLDRGIAQNLVQSVVLLASLLLFGACSLLTGSEKAIVSEDLGKSGYIKDRCNICGDDSKEPSAPCRCRHRTKRNSLTVSGKLPSAGAYPSNKNPFGDSSVYKRESDNVEFSHSCDERARLVPKTNSSDSSLLGKLSARWKRNKKMFCLCVLTFLGLVTNYAYFVYVTNYVAQVIYSGDPYGLPGSIGYENYVEGVHAGSLSMLTFYCVFVLFNLFHKKILEKISMRTEYVAVTVGCASLILTLALTNNVVVLFVNAVIMATYRSAVYTIPFILANNYAREESQQLLDNDPQSKASDKTGVAMATITAMVPASYFLVSLVMGPLMDVTGNPGTPIFIASGSCFLSLLAIVFVKFD